MGILIKAPAKLNLTLDVVGTREDGYHLLDMIVQTVDLFDELELELTDSGEITLWEDSGKLPCDKDNLAFAAARLILDKVQSNKGVDIKLKKRIPVAAGLGGGSSDAAAVLKGVNSLLDSPFTIEQLAEMSVVLGADVPMCVLGGCLRAQGIGEELERLGKLPECYILLTKNGYKPSTGQMFRRLGEMGIDRRPDTESVAKGIADADLKAICSGIYNVFLPVYDSVVAEDIELMKNTNALSCGLSGSGPSVFGIFKNRADAEKAAEKFKTAGKTAYVCQPTE